MSIRLINGDCLEVLKTIPDASVDLVICDLPYGVLGAKDIIPKLVGDHHNRTKAQTGCPWDVKIDLAKFWVEIKRILKNTHCPVIHFCTTRFGYELIKSNESWFRYDLVWDKQRGVSFLSASRMPMRSHEMIYVFSKAGTYYNRVDIPNGIAARKSMENYIRPGNIHGAGLPVISKKVNATDRCVLSVIQTHTSSRKGQHPTEKPIDLYRWLIERYCPVGGTVLDPTFGSGNSVIIARDMGRHAIGIEKDKAFYEKALARITPPQNTIA